ncbi:MAG: L-threonylcarbamoyladenylate synthase [Pyrinomonadaceae bacterium]
MSQIADMETDHEPEKNGSSRRTLLTRSAAEAALFIRKGGVVAFPTETVFGLGADAFDENAVARIFEAKNRPPDNPLIIHIGERSQIEMLAEEVPESAAALIDRFFPGPLTVVLKKKDAVPLIVSAGLETVGIRMPGNEITSAFLKECGVPVAAPSANISGRPSPTDWRAVQEDLDGRIDCILQGEATEVGIESTVVDCTKPIPEILRPGAVSIEELRRVVPAIRASDLDADEAAASPGLRHKHYSPSAAVVVVRRGHEIDDLQDSGFIGLWPPISDAAKTLVCSTPKEYASKLFAFFRECDRAGIAKIYCGEVPEEGIGTALMDRLRRAAER